MSSDARCIGPNASLVDAASLMRQLDVGAIPVCDNDRLAGMLTDRDIAIRAVADGRDPAHTTVRDAMSPGIIYVYEDQSIDEAAQVMEEHQVRRLPVLNRDKRLVGIVSLGDLAVQASARRAGDALKEVSQPTAHSRSM